MVEYYDALGDRYRAKHNRVWNIILYGSIFSAAIALLSVVIRPSGTIQDIAQILASFSVVAVAAWDRYCNYVKKMAELRQARVQCEQLRDEYQYLHGGSYG